jgi:hypothetical protein
MTIGNNSSARFTMLSPMMISFRLLKHNNRETAIAQLIVNAKWRLPGPGDKLTVESEE